jgi:hypothetical protein
MTLSKDDKMPTDCVPKHCLIRMAPSAMQGTLNGQVCSCAHENGFYGFYAFLHAQVILLPFLQGFGFFGFVCSDLD